MGIWLSRVEKELCLWFCQTTGMIYIQCFPGLAGSQYWRAVAVVVVVHTGLWGVYFNFSSRQPVQAASVVFILMTRHSQQSTVIFHIVKQVLAQIGMFLEKNNVISLNSIKNCSIYHGDRWEQKKIALRRSKEYSTVLCCDIVKTIPSRSSPSQQSREGSQSVSQ